MIAIAIKSSNYMIMVIITHKVIDIIRIVITDIYIIGFSSIVLLLLIEWCLIS